MGMLLMEGSTGRIIKAEQLSSSKSYQKTYEILLTTKQYLISTA